MTRIRLGALGAALAFVDGDEDGVACNWLP